MRSAVRARLLGVDIGGGLLDQRDDVAHAEDAAGDARGSKVSSASIFSPVPISLIGLPVTARIDSAAPPRPSPSTRVMHDAGEADALVERAREIDRVLAGQRIGDQQHFMRLGGALRLRRLPPSSLRRA